MVGDRLGLEPKKKRGKKELPGAVHPAFSALYQGDHLGVEYALGAHEGLLAEGPVWRGLIIDDFFVITSEKEEPHYDQTTAFKILEEARIAYDRHHLPGSVEKDVVASRLFKAAGAEIDSRCEVTSRG